MTVELNEARRAAFVIIAQATTDTAPQPEMKETCGGVDQIVHLDFGGRH